MIRATAGLLALLAALTGEATADELRLENGEIVYGAVVESRADALLVEVQGKRRSIRRSEVETRLEGEPPEAELERREAALATGDAGGRAKLALFAWSRRLDADALRLARAALEVDPVHAGAHALLGHVRNADGWVDGWPAPWPARWQSGPRWRAAKRARRPAVREALGWLAAHQDEDGRLDADAFAKHCPDGDTCGGAGGGHHGERVPSAYDGATTALAVMAWMAEGSTPVSGPHAHNVARGLAFLRAEGLRARGFDAIWNVAFATQALADACAFLRDPSLRGDVEAGVDRLLASQRADGGWSYVYAIGDVPTTAVVLLALGQAAQAGIGIERGRVERALAFLEARVDARSGRSEYHDGAERKGYTPTRANAAATLAARAHLGVLGATPRLGRRLGAVSGRKPRWKIAFEEVKTRDGRTVRAQVGNLYPYAWYVSTLALAERGGASWSGWRRALRRALADGQCDEGHAAGSWDPLGTYSSSGGRAFVTGLCALMLQSDYRYPRRR